MYDYISTMSEKAPAFTIFIAKFFRDFCLNLLTKTFFPLHNELALFLEDDLRYEDFAMKSL